MAAQDAGENPQVVGGVMRWLPGSFTLPMAPLPSSKVTKNGQWQGEFCKSKELLHGGKVK